MKVAILLLGFLSLAPAVRAEEPPAAAPEVRELRVGPFSETDVGIEFLFEGAKEPCGRRLRGTFSLFRTGGVAVDGPVAALPAGGCSIRYFWPFSATTADMLTDASVTEVEWSFGGERSGDPARRSVAWAGTVPRERVKLAESMKVTLRRFVTLKDLRVGAVAPKRTALVVDLDVRNPLGFDLRIVEASYELTIAGKPVARGSREKFIVHAGVVNSLQVPVELSHAGILGAIWETAAGGEVEGTLAGIARVRLPLGDVDFPFEFPVRLRK